MIMDLIMYFCCYLSGIFFGVMFIMGIEEEFDIEIDNDEAEKISTVQDAVDQIKKVVE